MIKEIFVSGLRYWINDSETHMQTAGIVNPRIEAEKYSRRGAFTAGRERDENNRRAYADKTDRFRPR